MFSSVISSSSCGSSHHTTSLLDESAPQVDNRSCGVFHWFLPARRYHYPLLHSHILLPYIPVPGYLEDINIPGYVLVNTILLESGAIPGTYCHLSCYVRTGCSSGWKNQLHYQHPEKCFQLHAPSFETCALDSRH